MSMCTGENWEPGNAPPDSQWWLLLNDVQFLTGNKEQTVVYPTPFPKGTISG
jgi:hypothetical protein